MYKEILEVPVLRELMDLSELPANQPSGVSDPNCPNKGILASSKYGATSYLIDVIAPY